MQESHSPPGFEPEVTRTGYDMNMVRTDPIKPGSASPVMVGEYKMLDEEMNSRTLELAGRVPMETPAMQKMTNFPGPYSPKSHCVSSKTDSSQRCWTEDQSRIEVTVFLMGLAFGADTFWASRTSPFLLFRFWHTRLRPGIESRCRFLTIIIQVLNHYCCTVAVPLFYVGWPIATF